MYILFVKSIQSLGCFWMSRVFLNISGFFEYLGFFWMSWVFLNVLGFFECLGFFWMSRVFLNVLGFFESLGYFWKSRVFLNVSGLFWGGFLHKNTGFLVIHGVILKGEGTRWFYAVLRRYGIVTITPRRNLTWKKIGKTPPYWSANAPDLSPTHGQRIGILTRHLYPTGDLYLWIHEDDFGIIWLVFGAGWLRVMTSLAWRWFWYYLARVWRGMITCDDVIGMKMILVLFGSCLARDDYVWWRHWYVCCVFVC